MDSFFYNYALEKQNLSIIASLDESWIVISILIGAIFFGEVVGLIHIISILAVLVGAFIISTNFKTLKQVRILSGTGYEFLSILFVGIALPLQKVLIDRIGEGNTIFYLNVIIFFLIFVWKFITREKFTGYQPKFYKIALLSGTMDGVAFAASIFAIKSADIAIISPILASSVIVSIVLAKIYLKEKMKTREILGALLILGGVILLTSLSSFG